MSPASCNLFDQPACTACNPPIARTPLSLVNRPGLGALSYRVGTFMAFRQAMLDALVLQPVWNADPSKASGRIRLATWSSDDYGVAILELWAYVCDVLSLYQQSIANESFIRTAVLRESVARLAALLGYEPFRGVAATALLALYADAGATADLPTGLKFQSIPPPGKNPVTFELSQALAINSAANLPVLMGEPIDDDFKSSGNALDESKLPPPHIPGPPLVPGTKLVFYNSMLQGEQLVSAVTPTKLGDKLVQWRGCFSPALRTSTKVARFGRKFRWFGAYAPKTFPVLSGTTWSNYTTDFSLNNASQVFLDGTYDGIALGGRLLICTGTASVEATITQIAQGAGILNATKAGADAVPVMSAACTVLTISNTSVTTTDSRSVSIYELLGDNVPFRDTKESETISDGASKIYVTDPSGIGPGTLLLLVSKSDSTVLYDVATVTSITPTLSGNPPSQGPPYALNISPNLTNDYTVANTVLYANVAYATQGESQPEKTLGDGDASQEWQEFQVPVSPVTYVPDATTDSGAASTLRVFVDGIEWKEVPTFYQHGPDEPIFTTRIDDAGNMFARFGDGKTGWRLPTGRGNVTAQMRKGLGDEGNVAPETISVLLQPRPGLKSVVNPLVAYGGRDAESIDLIREKAPLSVLTLDRIVSLRDYEALALRWGMAKAKANWTDLDPSTTGPSGSDRGSGVVLTVAAAGGTALDQLIKPLHDFLDAHRDPNVPLIISPYTAILFKFTATVHLQANYKQSDVQAAIETRLGPDNDSGYLSFAQLQFGQTIFASAVIEVIQDTPGVEWVEVKEFFPWSQPDRCFGGTATVCEAIIIEPGEMARPTTSASMDAPGAVTLQYLGGITTS